MRREKWFVGVYSIVLLWALGVGTGGTHGLLACQITFDISPPEAGAILVGSESYGDGDTLKLPAAACLDFTAESRSDLCWKFDRWTEGTAGTENPVKVWVKSDMTIGARFVRDLECLRSKVSVEPPGAATFSLALEENDRVTITASPVGGFRFYHWRGAASGTDPKVTIPATDLVRDGAVIVCERITVNLTIKIRQPGGGTVRIDDDEYGDGSVLPVSSGTTLHLDAQPAPAFQFVAWEGDFSGTAPEMDITVETDSLVTCIFAVRPPESIRYRMAICLGEPLEVTWDCVDGAAGYELEGRVEDGDWTPVLETASTAYVDEDQTGATYAYRVRTVAGEDLTSEWQTGGTGRVLRESPVPQDLSVETACGRVRVSWQGPPGATFELEEAATSDFSDASVVYTGPQMEWVGTRDEGCYVYRVRSRACDLPPSDWTSTEACTPVTELLGFWPLDSSGDEASGGPAALVSGSAAENRFGQPGQSVRCEPGQWIILEDLPGIGETLTVTFWVSFPPDSGVLMEIAGSEDDTEVRLLWDADARELSFESTGPDLELPDALKNIRVSSIPWHHVGVVLGPEGVVMYMDGTEVAAVPIPADAGNTIVMGRTLGDESAPGGVFDDLRMFCSAEDVIVDEPVLVVRSGPNNPGDTNEAYDVLVPALQAGMEARGGPARITGTALRVDAFGAVSFTEITEVVVALDLNGNGSLETGEPVLAGGLVVNPDDDHGIVAVSFDDALELSAGEEVYLLALLKVGGLEERAYALRLDPGKLHLDPQVPTVPVGLPVQGGKKRFSPELPPPSLQVLKRDDKAGRFFEGDEMAVLHKVDVRTGSTEDQSLRHLRFKLAVEQGDLPKLVDPRLLMDTDGDGLLEEVAKGTQEGLDPGKEGAAQDAGEEAIAGVLRFDDLDLPLPANRITQVILVAGLPGVSDPPRAAGAVTTTGTATWVPPLPLRIGLAVAILAAFWLLLRGRQPGIGWARYAGAAAVLAAIFVFVPGCRTKRRTYHVTVTAPLQPLGAFRVGLTADGDIRSVGSRSGEDAEISGLPNWGAPVEIYAREAR